MPKITAAIAALLLAIGLTGCGAAEPPADAQQQTPTESAKVTSEPSESPTPLVAESPSANPETAADAAFLSYVRDKLLPDTQIPNATDEQLIAAGHDACDQLENGTKLEDVRVIDGEKPHSNGAYYDTSAIMNAALVTYCPGAA